MLTKKAIYAFLETTEGFNKEIDTWIVDEFIYTLGLIRKAKKQIRNDGNTIIINVSKEPNKEVLQPSAAFASYRALIKQALDLTKHLPLTPKARKDLAEMVDPEKDDFNA